MADACGVYDFYSVITGEKDAAFFYFYVWIDCPGGLGECFGLGQAYILPITEIQSVQIALLYSIEIDYVEPSHAGPYQVHGAGRPYAAEPVHRHPGGLKGFQTRAAQEYSSPIFKIATQWINAPARRLY